MSLRLMPIFHVSYISLPRFIENRYEIIENEVKNKNRFNQKDIDQLIELMNKASKPIFYTGGGVVNSGPRASELLRELVALTGFPITSCG